MATQMLHILEPFKQTPPDNLDQLVSSFVATKLRPTTFTAALILVVVVFAKRWWIRLLWGTLMLTSVLYHGKYFENYDQRQYIKKLDIAMTNICASVLILLAVTARPLFSIYTLTFWVCLAYVYTNYHVLKLVWHPDKADMFHSSIHIVSIIGAVCIFKAHNMIF